MGGVDKLLAPLGGRPLLAHSIATCEYVLVHDGARPLVTAAMIDAALAGAREKDAAICAIQVSDTVKQVDNYGFSRRTMDRDGLMLAQTPQAFRLELLLRAHAAHAEDVTDDAMLVELMGLPVRIVAGSPRNLKVTTPDDLVLAEALLKQASA